MNKLVLGQAVGVSADCQPRRDLPGLGSPSPQSSAFDGAKVGRKRQSYGVKKLLTALAGGLVLMGSSQAALIDRGGGMIYDSDLQITWVQNANLATGSVYDDGASTVDGRMSWINAKAWAENLVYGGFSDWRLPTTSPVNGVALQPIYDPADHWTGTRDVSYNVSAPASAYPGSKGSELAYMYYNNLWNLGYLGSTGALQAGFGLVDDALNAYDESLFIELKVRPGGQLEYWSGTAYSEFTGGAWYFNLYDGLQSASGGINDFYAWAVRDGDVAEAPEPASLALVGAALAAMLAIRRRRPLTTTTC